MNLSLLSFPERRCSVENIFVDGRRTQQNRLRFETCHNVIDVAAGNVVEFYRHFIIGLLDALGDLLGQRSVPSHIVS